MLNSEKWPKIYYDHEDVHTKLFGSKFYPNRLISVDDSVYPNENREVILIEDVYPLHVWENLHVILEDTIRVFLDIIVVDGMDLNHISNISKDISNLIGEDLRLDFSVRESQNNMNKVYVYFVKSKVQAKCNKPIESYAEFADYFGISLDELYNFGIEETICPKKELVENYWEELKRKVFNDEVIHIRKAGRKGELTSLYIDFINHIWGNKHVKTDASNNTRPTQIIRGVTGFKKYNKKRIDKSNTVQNYQVSHVFDNSTKNPLLFEAPWNLIYAPKMIDPFTGHETTGDVAKYSKMLQEKVYGLLGEYINDYNKIIIDLKVDEKLDEFIVRNNLDLNSSNVKEFVKGIQENYCVINIGK